MKNRAGLLRHQEDQTARTDDYLNARNIAAGELADTSLADLAKRTGFSTEGENTLVVPFLDRTYLVTLPDFRFTDADDAEKEVPLQEQVLILHYLQSGPSPETGTLVAYREIKDASFYFGPFTSRAINPLKKVFGENHEGLEKTAPLLSGTPIADGDAGYVFRPLPGIPIRMILWAGDDEFPPEANILFDSSIAKILSAEDIAWLTGMVIYRLIALSYR